MQNDRQVIDRILEQVKQTENVSVLQTAQPGKTELRNELVMFAKPEIFLVNNDDAIRTSLNMIFDKLDEFGAQVDGVAIVGGKALEEHGIMNRHYGFINQMSRRASEITNEEDRARIAELLQVSLDEYQLLGGHELLVKYLHLNPASLDELWFSKKSQKVRGGFYVQAYEVNGDKVVMVNGFHPAQLAHFTQPERRLLLILVHSNSEWGKLRNEMIGATFPEKADPNSIRGTLYANPARYGFDSVGIGNNGVHLSAGPYEGAFEAINFFSNLTDYNPQQQPPLIIQRLIDSGLSREEALDVTKNPSLVVNGKQTDLFGSTEDVDTDEAVKLFINHKQ